MGTICERGFSALNRSFYYVNHENLHNYNVNYETLCAVNITSCTIQTGTLTQEQALLKVTAWFWMLFWYVHNTEGCRYPGNSTEQDKN